MKMKLADLWDWRGTTERGPYVLWALLLCTVKIALDFALVSSLGGSGWSYGSYSRSLIPAATWSLTHGALALLGAASLPFMWAGLVLTIGRLRSAGLHPAWSVCFFIPFVKLMMFVGLAFLPPAPAAREIRRPGWLGRLIPEGRPCGVVSAILTALVAVAFVALGTLGFRSYGWTLFLSLPFFFGMTTSLLYGYHARRTLGACLAHCCVTLLIFGGALMLFALEGIICILMAAPIVGGISLAGSVVGWLVQNTYWTSRGNAQSLAMIALMLPGAMSLEAMLPAQSPLNCVTTTLEISAPREVVWKNVVAFSDLPKPTEWIFSTGLAYPTHAEISGTGVGAVRRCCFSTGDFIEPITTWDEPHHLAFSVEQNPPPMIERNPFGPIEPPHLHGYMVSERGQFLLVDLGDGRTRLEGTTWYRHGLFPAAYWRLWSDFVIHRIHLRVLQHVKNLSESDAAKVLQ